MESHKISLSQICWNFFLLSSFLIAVCGEQEDIEEFRRSLLDCHNKYRGTHTAGPLKIDDELNDKASKLAEKAAETGKFKLKPGENAYMSCATFKRDVSGEEIANAWYGEVCKPIFDFKNPDNDKARSFTQMVWKDTQRLGIGRAIKSDTGGEICTYIIAVYRPPGNLKGFFKENVEEGTFDRDSFCSNKSSKKSAKHVKRNQHGKRKD